MTFAAEWDMIAHRPTDIGHGVMLPERFTARFTVADDHTVEMDIATSGGAPVCDAIRVQRHPDRPSLTGHELRRLPLSDWVAFACSVMGFANQGGVHTTSAEWQSEAYRADVEGVVRRSRRRTTLNDNFLREVARVYREHADTAPIEAIRRAWPSAYPTAARWVKLARDRGFLPPTTRGKVSIDG